MRAFPRKTWVSIVIASGLGLVVAYGVSFITLLNSAGEEFAEADLLDPGWRLKELEEKRQVIPNEENSALVVLAAAKLWSVQPHASKKEFWAEGGIEQSIMDLPPEIQLNPKELESLRKELEEATPALDVARKLVNLPRGRYPKSGSLECQEARRIATLLDLDSTLDAQANQADEALATALGILNAGRSIGDEPITISQLVRSSCEMVAIRQVERVLAQGEPSQKALLPAQQLFQDEASQPLLLIGVRGARAETQKGIEYVREPLLPFVGIGGLRACFRLQTKCVEAAKAPIEEQLARLQEIKSEVPKSDPMVRLCFSSHEKFVSIQLRSQTFLRCVYVGLAAEKYRQVHGRWPDSLAALVPEFLKELPNDPYNGSPLKYRRLDDGVVIYSVGPDGQDNCGKLDRQNSTAAGTDVGFQLWDVSRRRQPWR